jgi:hypothetical protein
MTSATQTRSRLSGRVSKLRKGREEKGRDDRLTLKEDLEDTSGLFVDQSRNSLDTSSSSETSDGGLGDTLAARQRKRRTRQQRKQLLAKEAAPRGSS